MSCTTQTVTFEKTQVPILPGRNGHNERAPLLRQGRRHSYDSCPRRQSSVLNPDALYFRVDLFLNDLKRRLDRLEKYKQESLVHFDAHLERGYNALRDVRDSCSPFSSGELLWGAAKQRAQILVDTLETRYNDVMPLRKTLEEKAQASMRVMEGYLSELESSANSHRQNLVTSWDTSLKATRDLVEETFDKARQAKDVLRESIALALSQAAETRLIAYSDLPVPWQSNPYVLKGYRFHRTTLECCISIFHPHNELVNIWSHLIGFLIVLSIAFYFYPTSQTFSLSSNWDVLIAACFLAAACKCLISSVMWHTMNSIADKCLYDRFACVDYSGIAVLVAASILTTEWTAFYCEPTSQAFYMSLTILLGITGSILPWRESFNRPDMSWFRVIFYVSLALTGFVPIFQLSYTRGLDWTLYFYAPIGKSVLVYFAGAIVYASQVPEKWFPGAFDYCGYSHNIWHLAVLGGILFHYMAMIEFFQGAFHRVEMGQAGCLARAPPTGTWTMPTSTWAMGNAGWW